MTYEVEYLLTGVTGGLAAKVLDDMLNTHKIPPSKIVVTTRSPKTRERFESLGLQWRELDYDRPETIASALKGVNNLFFVSSPSFNPQERNIQHQNVVDGAKAAGVGTTWYVSLAFGGFEVSETVAFQVAHNRTEEMLMKSGINFVSLRAGVYADAFPIFMNWYPSLKHIYLPELDPPVTSGQQAWVSRDELGEGMTTLFVKGLAAYPNIVPKTDRRIILLTATKTITYFEIAEAINDNRPQKQPIEFLPVTKWQAEQATDDEGGKSAAYFDMRTVWFKEMNDGACKDTDPALKTLLGREPLDGVQVVAKLLKANPNYTWHQNDQKR